MATKILKTLTSSTGQDVYKVTVDWNDDSQIENKPLFKTINGESILGDGNIDTNGIKVTDITPFLTKSNLLFLDKSTSQSYPTGISYYFKATPGAQYEITATGNDRFQIGGFSNIPSAGSAVLIFSNKTTTDYTFVNSDNYEYILVGLAYAVTSPTIKVIETIDTKIKISNNLGYGKNTTLSQEAITKLYSGEKMFIDFSENLTSVSYLPNSGKFAMFSDSKGYYFKVSPGATYKVRVSGEHNRFILVGTFVEPVVNVGYEIIANDASLSEYIFTNDKNYEYVHFSVVLQNMVMDPKVEVTTEFENKASSIELSQTLGYDDNLALSQSVITKMYSGEDMNVDLSHKVAYVDFLINGNTYTTFANSKGCYFKASPNSTYNIKVEGDSNRFQLFGDNVIPTSGKSTGTKIMSDNSAKEYTVVNTENYEYLFVGLVYSNADFDPIVTVTEIFKNGLLPDEQIQYPFYISKADIGAEVNTTAMVYELYDELVTKYPNYIVKNILGQNSEGTNINEYIFTTGDYNDCVTKRSKDEIFEKPTILVVSGVHGYERADVLSTYKFFADMANGNSTLMFLRENYKFKLIPVVTPGAFDRNTRCNENGVNINRNFTVYWAYNENFGNDYAGLAAADQPETVIVENWLETNKNAILYIDHHNSGFTNEITYLAGSNSISGMLDFKKDFLKAMSECNAYWVSQLGFSEDNINYTGNFAPMACSQYAAENVGLFSVCLETSWEQNGTPRHGPITNKVGAEALGNMLKFHFEKQ